MIKPQCYKLLNALINDIESNRIKHLTLITILDENAKTAEKIESSLMSSIGGLNDNEIFKLIGIIEKYKQIALEAIDDDNDDDNDYEENLSFKGNTNVN